MNKEVQIQSRKVCCCGARSWALVIGWLHTIGSAIGTILLGILLLMAIASVGSGYGDRRNGDKLLLGMLVVFVISLVIQFAAGIVLIVGVQQGSRGKLTFWCVIQTIGIASSFFGLVALAMVGNDQGVSVTQSALGMAGSVFCLWVVNVHRQEIVNSSVSHVQKV